MAGSCDFPPLFRLAPVLCIIIGAGAVARPHACIPAEPTGVEDSGRRAPEPTSSSKSAQLSAMT